MDCIEIWVFLLDEREKNKFYYGGVQMDKARALFRALLPPDDTLYTAAEIVRRYFPGVSKKKDPELFAIYEAHHKALNRLMRDSNYYAKPDNQDPETGSRPRGKGRTARQPRRWNRATWLWLLSDDVHEWLMTLRQKLISQTAALPQGTRFFCNLATFETSYEEPPAEEIPEAEPRPEFPAPAAKEDQATEPDNHPGPDQPSEKEPAPAVEPDEQPEVQAEEVAPSNQADKEADEPVSKRCRRIWLPVSAVAATFLLAILLMRPFKTADLHFISTRKHKELEAHDSLSDQLSFREAARQTKTNEKAAHAYLALISSENHNWDGRPSFHRSVAYAKNDNLKLFLMSPITLASIP